MSLTRWVKKIGLDLFSYFFKGGRVDAALQWAGRSRMPLREYPRHDAVPIENKGSNIIYDQADIIRHWQITIRGILTLKNNSKNHAYNIMLLNSKELFHTCDQIPKLTSLAPNEKLELKVSFIHYMDAHSGQETEVISDIPAEKENRHLIIQYENERGTRFLTKFCLSFKTQYNEYTYK